MTPYAVNGTVSKVTAAPPPGGSFATSAIVNVTVEATLDDGRTITWLTAVAGAPSAGEKVKVTVEAAP